MVSHIEQGIYQRASPPPELQEQMAHYNRGFITGLIATGGCSLLEFLALSSSSFRSLKEAAPFLLPLGGGVMSYVFAWYSYCQWKRLEERNREYNWHRKIDREV